MKLVIDISKEFYDGLFDESYDSIRNIPLEHMVLVQKIKNGTPLPEHHGNLIDRDAINERFYNICKEAYACPCQPSDKYLLDKLSMCVDTAPVIIEAEVKE